MIAPAVSPLRRGWRFFGHQSTGIVCALLSAALLATGSFVMDRAPELYSELSMDDVRFFFDPWRWQHAWFYAFCLTLTCWGASALVCTWDSVASRLRRRVLSPSAYGAPLLHVTFVLALVAHLWGGLRTTSGRYFLETEGTAIDGVTYRALRIDQDAHPNGMPRTVNAVLERKVGSATDEVTVGYNHPLTSGVGAHELLLGQYDVMTDGIVLRHKNEQVVLRPGESIVAAGDTLVLQRLHDPQQSPSLRVPVAELLIQGQRMMLPFEVDRPGDTAFVGFHEAVMVMLVQRNNPSVPLVVLVSVLLVLGVVLVAWERVRTSRSISSTPAEPSDAS